MIDAHPPRDAARPLPGAEDRVAQALAEANAPLTVTELRRACRIRTATLCAILSDLVTDGRVRRTPAGYLPVGCLHPVPSPTVLSFAQC